MKTDLALAKLSRRELWLDDAQCRPYTFHACRHTAITHWAVAGREPHWLLLVAGHSTPEMTRKYLDGAAVVRGSFGTPHPPLPSTFLEEVTSSGNRGLETPHFSRRNTASPAGVEPALAT